MYVDAMCEYAAQKAFFLCSSGHIVLLHCVHLGGWVPMLGNDARSPFAVHLRPSSAWVWLLPHGRVSFCAAAPLQSRQQFLLFHDVCLDLKTRKRFTVVIASLANMCRPAAGQHPCETAVPEQKGHNRHPQLGPPGRSPGEQQLLRWRCTQLTRRPPWHEGGQGGQGQRAATALPGGTGGMGRRF